MKKTKIYVDILCYADNYSELEKDYEKRKDLGLKVESEDEFRRSTERPKKGVIFLEDVESYHPSVEKNCTVVYLSNSSLVVCESFEKFDTRFS